MRKTAMKRSSCELQLTIKRSILLNEVAIVRGDEQDQEDRNVYQGCKRRIQKSYVAHSHRSNFTVIVGYDESENPKKNRKGFYAFNSFSNVLKYFIWSKRKLYMNFLFVPYWVIR